MLFASNFSLVWKQVLYFFVCFLFFFILSLKIAQPIIDILKSNGINSEVDNLVDSIYELNKINGINNVKAIQLKAIKELFVRFSMNNIIVNESIKLSSGYDVYNYANLKYNNKFQEKLVVFYLNIKNIIIFMNNYNILKYNIISKTK